tara:strand:+ start:994 stop:1317 length:324 start_codon:yes stop_codon:yes gene_type:complete
MPDNVLDNVKNLAFELQVIRDYCCESIIINSGYRCPSYNRSVKGVKNSQHLLGKAADIVIQNIRPTFAANMVEDMLELEHLFPFFIGGIGRYDTFTHVDIRPTKARW